MTRLPLSDGKYWWNTLLPPRLKCVSNLNGTFRERWRQWNSLRTNINGEWPQRCMATTNSLSIHCRYYLHEEYCCIFLVDEFGISIVVLVACMVRNQYSAIQKFCNTKTMELKGLSPFLNSALLHGILKRVLYIYHSVIIFHFPELCVLVFLTTPINAVIFWSKCFLWILYLLETLVKSFAGQQKNLRRFNPIFANTSLWLRIKDNLSLPPLVASVFMKESQNRLTDLLWGDLKFIKLFQGIKVLTINNLVLLLIHLSTDIAKLLHMPINYNLSS